LKDKIAETSYVNNWGILTRKNPCPWNWKSIYIYPKWWHQFDIFLSRTIIQTLKSTLY